MSGSGGPRTDDLPSIGLDELRARAGLQVRRDRTYVLDGPDSSDLFDRLGLDLRVLEVDGRRHFHYETVYVDTPGLDLFLQGARRRPRRVKVRSRLYRDSGECHLEVKRRDRRGLTTKHRRAHPADGAGLAAGLDDAARSWVDERAGLPDRRAALLPSLVVGFTRTTCYVPGSAARITLDHDLVFHDPRGEVDGAGRDPAGLRKDPTAIDRGGPAMAVPDLAIVETKSAGPVTDADRALWRLGHRPITLSKYGVGLAALRPGLPANPWHRVLTRHVPTTR